jgi:hypothetical protein
MSTVFFLISIIAGVPSSGSIRTGLTVSELDLENI